MSIPHAQYLEDERISRATFVLVASLVLAGLTLFAALQMSLRSVQAKQLITLVFPPFWSQSQSLFATATLDVDIVAGGRLPFTTQVILRGDDSLKNAAASGVLLALPGDNPFGCGPSSTIQTRIQ